MFIKDPCENRMNRCLMVSPKNVLLEKAFFGLLSSLISFRAGSDMGKQRREKRKSRFFLAELFLRFISGFFPVRW